MSFLALDSWFASHLPEVAHDLAAPASPEEIELFKQTMNMDVPDAFFDLYRWHNGQQHRTQTGCWYGLFFLSLKQIVHEWQLMMQHATVDLSVKQLNDLNQRNRTAVFGTVKPVYMNANWIPFAHDLEGNYIGIDLDPDLFGKRGQVINFGRDEDCKYVLAEDISAFIDWYATQLSRGNFSIEDEEEGYRSFNTKRPETYHFMEAIPKIWG